MRKASFAYFCLLAIVGIASGATPHDEACETLAPWEPGTWLHSPCKGIIWQLNVPKCFTTYDSLWISSNLDNSTNRRFEFGSRIRTTMPTMVLTRDGERSTTQPLSVQNAMERFTLNRFPQPGETFHSFCVDLRTYYGKLAPGEYQLYLVWPKADYFVIGMQDSEPADLKSPVVKFTVKAARPDDASKVIPQAYEMMVPDQKAITKSDDIMPMARLTNKRKTPIEFRYDAPAQDHQNPNVPPTIDVPLTVRKWAGEGWQVPERYSLPKKELSTYTLNPGASVTVRPLDRTIREDGIYSYELNAWSTGEQPIYQLSIASGVFVIDRIGGPQPK